VRDYLYREGEGMLRLCYAKNGFLFFLLLNEKRVGLVGKDVELGAGG